MANRPAPSSGMNDPRQGGLAPSKPVTPTPTPRTGANQYLLPGVNNPWPTVPGAPTAAPGYTGPSNGEELTGRGSFVTPGAGKFGPNIPVPKVPNAPDAGANFLHSIANNSSLVNFLNQSGSTPDSGNYLNQFHQSLSAARGNIHQQLAAALADISSSQGAANAAIGTLPGSIKRSYDQYGQGMAAAGQVNRAGLAANGFANTGLAEANLAPEQQAVANTQMALQAQVPLLSIGAQQQATSQRAQANNLALGDLSNLDSQQAQGDLQYGQNQQSNAASVNNNRQTSLNNYYLSQMQPGAAGAGGGSIDSAGPKSPEFSSAISTAYSTLQGAKTPQEHAAAINYLKLQYGNNPALWQAIQKL